jgi:C4-dicarboxylate-specific signal transduction histidine kinase
MMHPMTKVIIPWLVLVGFAGAASAQPAAPPAPAGTAPAPAADAQPPPPAEAHPALSPGDARKLCAQAMNADPKFAAEIVKTADEAAAVKRDADTLAAHTDAYAHIQKNERHVIYAYAAMWIVAALFVVFLWRRQQALRTEIANLRRDLEAAADEARPTGARS